MPRKADVDRPVPLNTTLPTSVYARLALHLHSELEGKVPKGAFQKFFIERIHEFFNWRRLDLGPFGFPTGFVITGPSGVIDALEERLKGIE